MDLPTRGRAHEALTAFAGEWSGTEELAETPWAPASRATATCIYRCALAGFAVVQDYEQTREDGTQFHGHNVFTVDPATGNTLWYGFDSYGFPPVAPARGGWREGALHLEKHTDRGVAQHRLATDGAVLTHEIDLRLGDDLEFRPFLRARYTRC
ncbi:DUF1579 family protein [Amycolatopsis jiangsuensis]|uniref:DUF1579 domain-containing protein n=1 Tax=Amycolatopsis jiangsuensis TaxID=1181879 RepID=A0A840J386_9PSEU|nr:DUF1579 family protein [Amycolatopsis jiangsuensis]MBB4687882.1 hypothetical protein [Amycolatopsis jiangsuensis]